jgi:hypothetical protein
VTLFTAHKGTTLRKNEPTCLGMRPHAPACAAKRTDYGSEGLRFESSWLHHPLSPSKDKLLRRESELAAEARSGDRVPNRVPTKKVGRERRSETPAGWRQSARAVQLDPAGPSQGTRKPAWAYTFRCVR